MLVKKLILALFLSVGICAVGAQTDVYASEPTVQEDGATGNDGEIRKEYVDLSDSVIQEGGFPKAAGTSRKSRSAVDSDKEKEVQKVLLATWDSFAESCDLSSYGLTEDELGTVYFGTLNTHPRYFYVDSSISYYINGGIVSRVIIEYAMDKGDLKMAIPYARELKRIGHRDRGDLSYIGAVLRCFAFSDLEQGVTLMANSFPWAAGLWDEKMAYDFYKGAGAVLHQLSKKEEHIPLALPEQFSCFRRDGVYPIKELEQWVYGQAEEIAGRFDARNGTNYFMDNLGLAVNYGY